MPGNMSWFKAVWKERRRKKRRAQSSSDQVLAKPVYQYKQLHHEDEIRVLILEPGIFSDPLVCNLVHTRLSSSPVYEAISYAWGDPSKPRQVICDGRVISVTQSLYSALQHLRHPEKSRTLWADAICINQDMNAEKNHQVALMSKIYSQAAKTTVWLGEVEDDLVRKAFNYLIRLDTYFKSCLTNYPPFEYTDFQLPRPMAIELDANWIPELYTSLGPLFACSWFERLWVLQEVVLSEVVEMAFSTRVLPFDTMVYPILMISRNLTVNWEDVNIPGDFKANLVNLFEFGVIREAFRRALPKTLFLFFETFRRTSMLLATDPRDQLYGLLGLGCTPGLIADYTLSVNEVFRDFVIWCLKQPNGIDVLGLAGLSNRAVDWASWIPKPRTNRREILCLHSYYEASGPLLNPSSSTSPEVWKVVGENVLEVKGAFIDDTATITQGRLRSSLENSIPGLKEIVKVAGCGQSDLTGERYRKLCQALTGVLVPNGDRASPTQSGLAHRCFQIASKVPLAFDEIRSIEMDYDDIWAAHINYLYDKRFCCTSQDRFAWVPKVSDVNDRICIFQGGRVPFVVRPQEDGKYVLVGECYVQGMMTGEALSLPDFRWETISLI